jgi:aminoglycoside 6-adenylyltransferase
MLCDSILKEQLLTMMEWHVRAIHGPQHDTWYNGRYLSEWADPQAAAALPATFAAYNPADLRRALQQTLTLYDRLASETAAHLTLSYPTPGQQATLTWLKSYGLPRN